MLKGFLPNRYRGRPIVSLGRVQCDRPPRWSAEIRSVAIPLHAIVSRA